jgi:hypothetical protein
VLMRTLKTVLFCGALAISPAMALGQTAPRPAEAVQHEPARTPAAPAAMPAAEAASYAAREAAAPHLQKFKGGASLSITLGTTALVVLAVLVVLIILL